MKENFCNGWSFACGSEKQLVNLPHDAMIDGKRSKDAPSGGSCAYFEGGVYTYSKTFDVPADWKDKHVYFEFEGVYRKASIYINENLAYTWANGYTGFIVDTLGFLKYGTANVIKVVADNSEQPNSRWYTGGGIYRPVWLHVKNKTHFEHFGITVETVSINPPTVKLSAKRTGGDVKFEVERNGKIVAEHQDEGELVIENAELWSAETPNLYTLKATLVESGKVVDEEEIKFGIRSLEWSTKGFFVNGNNVLLRGGCVHHDNGILGARAYTEAEERKVLLIKQAGFNAVRFSHNPCSKAFADACDKVGLYLIDEFSDMWYMRKKKFDYALDFDKWHKRDITAMVEKDFNHPSVIMYSIGNEVSEPYEQKGVETAKELVALVHSLDRSRPVTAGVNLFIINNAAKGKGQYSEEKVEADAQPKKLPEKPTSSTLFNMIATHAGPSMNKMSNSDEVDNVTSPVIATLDIAGYNYASGRYEMEAEKHPDRIIFGSETFPQDIWKNWQKVKKLPYLLGDFMWTAVDYLGEVGLGGWCYEPQYGITTFEKPYPWLIADTGAIDIIGTIGAEAKYASTVWGLESKPFIGVCPVNKDKKKLIKSVWRGTNAIESWSWKGCDGKKADVEVYTDAAFVDLYINGSKRGRKKVKECKAIFSVKYAKGNVTAVALNSKKEEIARNILYSAQEDLQITLSCNKTEVQQGEVLFINVDITDKNGIVESNADQKLTAKVEGGKILAFGSAQQKSEEKYSTNQTETYYGKALLVVQADGGDKLTVSVKGNSAQSEITVCIK